VLEKTPENRKTGRKATHLVQWSLQGKVGGKTNVCAAQTGRGKEPCIEVIGGQREELTYGEMIGSRKIISLAESRARRGKFQEGALAGGRAHAQKKLLGEEGGWPSA